MKLSSNLKERNLAGTYTNMVTVRRSKKVRFDDISIKKVRESDMMLSLRERQNKAIDPSGGMSSP